MGRLLMALALLVLAALTIFEIGRLLFAFAQEEPEFDAWEPLVGLLAWAVAVGILIVVARAPQTMHRVALALIVPMGVVFTTALMITGLGVLLLTFADLKEKVGAVAEPYAVIVALLLAVSILAGATFLARRGVGSQG